MNRLFNVILCGYVLLLTAPMLAEARPPRGTRSFNPGVHRSFPSRSSRYNRNSRSSTPYRQNYRRGGGRTYQDRDYRYDRGYNDYPRSRGRSRSRIRIEYEGSF